METEKIFERSLTKFHVLFLISKGNGGKLKKESDEWQNEFDTGMPALYAQIKVCYPIQPDKCKKKSLYA